MDITCYLNNNDTKEDKKKISINPLINEFTNNLNFYVKTNKINMLEFTFLIQFAKSNGSIININWLTYILNKINDNDFSTMTVSIFPKLLTKNNNQLFFNSQFIVDEFLEFKKDTMEFTNDQIMAITKIINFVGDRNKKTFGLYGFAGTGKTTTVVELVNFLLKNNYIISIAFTAPTNKAVNVMKSKMRSNIKQLSKSITGKDYHDDFKLEDILDDIYVYGIKIDFMTIHRLLNYKNEFDSEGDRIFIKSGKSSIVDYDIVIVDECSMIPIQIITHLFEDVRISNSKVGENYKKMPKLIFSGDPCQLPSVNENISAIFIKSKEQLPYDFFSKTIYNLEQNMDMKQIGQIQFMGSVKRHNDLVDDIINMETVVMKEVVRNKIDNVVNLCYHIREWIEKIIPVPTINKFIGDGIFVYKCNVGKKKIQTNWFNKFVELQKDNMNNNISNIILTWTNKQTDEYNSAIRCVLFKDKTNIEKFEIGDILMLNDFYNFDEVQIKNKDTKSNKFYTSEQIKVTDKEICTKNCDDFTEQVTKSMLKFKSAEIIISKYKQLVKMLNNKTTRNYTVWKLAVQKMSEAIIKNIIPESYTIYVIHDDSVNVLELEREMSLNLIKKFRKNMSCDYNDQANKIDKEIVRPLWKQWNKIFMDPFAKVNYGNSHSVHKSQGSSFYNVFVDADDILNNNNTDEAKRCIYTAFTRSSNEIHILI